jgi:ankyrin repeat protein/predicted DNA-binding protein (UPF0251 family)
MMPSDWLDPEALFVRQQQQQSVNALPQKQREAITLFNLEGYSQKEIARFLGVSVATVGKRLFDARKGLEKRILNMAKENLNNNKPDPSFADKVQFFIALKTGDADTMAQLLKKDATLADTKADSDVIHINRGTTPIDWAASVGDEAVIELLLQHGVDINKATSYDTPLHCAVMAGQHQTTRFLLSRKANVNASGGCDHTPLHRAVMRDDQEMVELLLKAGAQADATDFKGQTAADWAALKGYRSLL